MDRWWHHGRPTGRLIVLSVYCMQGNVFFLVRHKNLFAASYLNPCAREKGVPSEWSVARIVTADTVFSCEIHVFMKCGCSKQGNIVLNTTATIQHWHKGLLLVHKKMNMRQFRERESSVKAMKEQPFICSSLSGLLSLCNFHSITDRSSSKSSPPTHTAVLCRSAAGYW